MIIIPDIHGRTFWKKAIPYIEKGGKAVFLGDYTDPYGGEIDPLTSKTTKKEFVPDTIKELIELKKKYPDNVILLLGNHDASYCIPGMPKCRFDSFRKDEISRLLNENRKCFKITHIEEIAGRKVIFSHSGVEPEWKNAFVSLENLNIFDALVAVNFAWVDKDPKVMQYLNKVSYYRGGYAETISSPIWGDVCEFGNYQVNKLNHYVSALEGESYEHFEDDVFQIFGHTVLTSEPIIQEKFACLDARRIFELDEETLEIRDYNDDDEKGQD